MRDRDRGRETERERDGERDRDRERQGGRERDRERGYNWGDKDNELSRGLERNKKPRIQNLQKYKNQLGKKIF